MRSYLLIATEYNRQYFYQCPLLGGLPLYTDEVKKWKPYPTSKGFTEMLLKCRKCKYYRGHDSGGCPCSPGIILCGYKQEGE